MPGDSRRYWMGSVPAQCEVSGQPFDKVMYDCRIPRYGQWALVCQVAFEDFGCKVGQGFGQKYELQEDGKWLKTAG